MPQHDERNYRFPCHISSLFDEIQKEKLELYTKGNHAIPALWRVLVNQRLPQWGNHSLLSSLLSPVSGTHVSPDGIYYDVSSIEAKKLAECVLVKLVIKLEVHSFVKGACISEICLFFHSDLQLLPVICAPVLLSTSNVADDLLHVSHLAQCQLTDLSKCPHPTLSQGSMPKPDKPVGTGVEVPV